MGLDLDKFVKHLRDTKLSGFGNGKCSLHIRRSLQAGGGVVPEPYPESGKLWGPKLLQMGFREITVDDPAKFAFQKGDIMVMQNFQGGNANGHVAAYDGTVWISDFIQTDFWAGPGYRKHKPAYAVYRY